jgi:hypothetical protein
LNFLPLLFPHSFNQLPRAEATAAAAAAAERAVLVRSNNLTVNAKDTSSLTPPPSLSLSLPLSLSPSLCLLAFGFSAPSRAAALSPFNNTWAAAAAEQLLSHHVLPGQAAGRTIVCLGPR